MTDAHETTPASVWRNPIHFLAFGFGSGAIRPAPGTWGTLAALPFVLVWQHLPVAGYGLVIVLSTLLGIWLCHRTAADLGVHDHGGIVWDEFVGLWIALWLAPTGWPWLLAGFALAVAAALGVWLWRVGERRIAIALGLAIGGALSNVVDRLRWGAVIDFLDFHAFGWHWPAFNLADAAITIGVGGLVLASLMESRQKG